MKQLVFLAVLLVFAGGVWAEGLVGHWEFEGNANDSSGNGYNGVITQTFPGCTYSFVAGPFGGQAFESFDGCYVNITGSGAAGWADFQNSSMSISMWIKSSQCTGLAGLISKGSNAYKISQYGATSSGRVKAYANGPGASAGSSGAPYTGSTCFDGQWHHIVSVLSRAENKHKIYLDGQLTGTNYSLATDSELMVTNTYDLAIGANPAAGTSYYFCGAIDDVRIYDYALTEGEVVTLFNPLIAVNPCPAKGAVGAGLYPELSWDYADGVTGYDVYFGTDSSAVNNATIASSGIYQGYTDTNSIILAESFNELTTYYWRVDTIVNAEVSKGLMWQFKTCKGGDFDGDGVVGYEDLRLLTEDWLAQGDAAADGDGDGNCNMVDYAVWAKNLSGSAYYFDSTSGNDSYTGKSPQQAWRSLSKFNNTTFLPGDKIYFKTDSVWTGQLTPRGSGVLGCPIVIDAYGSDIYDQETKPCFNGEGNVNPTLYVRHVEYWEINNLQLTNQGATAGDWRSAVSISAEDFGTMDHIYLKKLYVHNVNSTAGTGGGIGWFCSSNGGVMTKFNNILIEGCLIENLGSWAIQGGNTHCGRIETATDPANTKDFYPSTNVVVRGNRISDIDSSGIIIIGTDGCIVEHNVIDKTMRTTQGGCGIWPWSADNTIVQYNEVYNCYDNGDGESYDADYNCRGSIFQYNYSHDNPGGFMRVCNGGDSTMGITGNYDTIIRYNISVKDGASTDGIFPTWKRCDNVQVYNNVIYSPTGTVPLVDTSASGGSGAIWYWSNNIFYSNGTLRYNIADGSTNYWSNNCFYGTHQVKSGWFWATGTPSDANKITSNPNFVNASLSAPMGINSLDGFKLQSGSPCIGTGKIITDNGGHDFWNNLLYNGNPDMGAQEQ